MDGEDARIADYFDVIAGTSTGGLIATLLTLPDGEGQPHYSAKDITNLYMDLAKKVFPPKSSAEQLITMLHGPKYSSKGLESILLEKLQDLKISDTTTHLPIPTFDIKLMQPVFFSTSKAQDDELKNPFLRDVCRGTSAAPTYLPPHFFQTYGKETQSFRDYNLAENNRFAKELVKEKRARKEARNNEGIFLRDYEQMEPTTVEYPVTFESLLERFEELMQSVHPWV
ncbi:hypothetical protein L7F22_047427 [Adiantum nelumboides]|nr:hypothetical protein [Adiantum nelumboides]